ncbi:MAG: PP2C family protein-serine/threonine phosphatase, partial [Chlamydiia bacterium]|nr:PP2C family protein-serine/threonine phosphatase [Chlamydiia bacterium]
GHPLQSLIGVMDQVGSGDLSRRFEKESMGFEINALGEIFNETVDALNQNMEAVQKERIEKETYEKELKIGEEVQHSIIPERLPAFPGLKMAARFIAAKEVGGDFYDLIPKERLMISIADSAGKGVSACLYSLSLRSMLRSFSELHSDLPTILKKTNNLFCQDTGNTGEFVTAFVAFFDPKTKVLEYSNCGHFPALRIKKNGEWDHLTTHGMALGVTLFEEVATANITLESGDLVVFFTDGIVEAHNEAMELFGEERLLHHLQEQKGKSPQEIVDAMIETVAFFAEGSPQFDDLTLIVVKVV